MRLTKYGHSCVRLEAVGRVLVVDPGCWAEPEALVDVDAILVTHEHADHVEAKRIAHLSAPVYGPATMQIQGIEVIGVSPDDDFEAAGFRVRAVGGQHASLDGTPPCDNLGYVVDSLVYHPGDSLFVPEQPIDTLLVPVNGSWLRPEDPLDFIVAVRPRRALPIHDANLDADAYRRLDDQLQYQSGGLYRSVRSSPRVGGSADRHFFTVDIGRG